MKRTKRIVINSYLLAIVTVCGGILISIHTSNWYWFSRTGSLLVIYGILLTSRQILEHIQQLKSLQRCDFPSQRDWVSSDKKSLVNDYHEVQWRNEAYGLYMLVVGTFIWGFGDLIGELVINNSPLS